jgi:Protein of unknown function (DUF3147)
MNYLEVFIIGGITVLSVTYVTEQIDDTYGAIIWAFPFTLIPSIYYLRKDGKSKEFISNFLLRTSLSLIILFITTISLSKFIHHRRHLGISIMYAVIIYFIISAIFLYIDHTYFS